MTVLNAKITEAVTARAGTADAANEAYPDEYWVTAEDKAALQTAINEAKAVSGNPAASQAQVDAAKADLDTALSAFIDAKMPGTKPAFTLYKDGESAAKTRAATLQEILDWFAIPGNTEQDAAYTIVLNADASIAPFSLDSATLREGGVTLTLQGRGKERKISLGETGSLFRIGSGYTLVLEDKITLKGRPDNTESLVYVETGGTLKMKEGACITGNTSGSGGGVWNNGTFEMTGGTISGNTAANYPGGGGVGNEGTFEMRGGTISGNTATTNGGGVWNSMSNVEMTGGTISGNTAGEGGGMGNNGPFKMTGGTISGNTATNGGGVDNKGTFGMTGGTISGNTADNGGGVFNDGSFEGTFEMTGGAISGNTADNGEGVWNDGTFEMTGGTILSNTRRQLPAR